MSKRSKKDREKYLEKKRKKIAAAEKENNHKMDYSVCPVRDEKPHINYPSDGFAEMALLMSMMRMRKKSSPWPGLK